MAATRRRSIPPLIRALEAEPYRFDFYQAVRILERARVLAPDADATPVGETGDPRGEAVRFSADPSLAFPASSIAELEPAARPDRPARMTTRFLGIAGALGPLPRPWTERLLARQAKKDHAWRSFLDIFNHRLIALMVRLRKAHRLALETEAPARSGLARYLFALIGLGAPSLRDRTAAPDQTLLRYAGLLAHRPRTAVGLERLLSDHYAAPVRVRQFVGAWLRLEPDQWTQLGARPGPAGGVNNALGRTAVIGARVWDQQAGLELRVGPLAYTRFLEFLPGGAAHRTMIPLVLFAATPEADVRLRLVVRKEEVPAMRLGDDLRLGWTTWLKTRDVARDDDQVAVTLRGQAALESV